MKTLSPISVPCLQNRYEFEMLIYLYFEGEPNYFTPKCRYSQWTWPNNPTSD